MRLLIRIRSLAGALSGYIPASPVDLIAMSHAPYSFGAHVSKISARTAQYFSTDAVDKENKESQSTFEKHSKEKGHEFSADQLEVELPNTVHTPQETVAGMKAQYKAILDEKDEALIRLSKQIEDERKQVLLALAEAENLRTRFARESQQTKKFAIQGFVQDLLGCLDNLDRAVDSVPKEVDAAVEDHRPNSTDMLSAMNGLLSGVRMTQKDFRNVLSSHGVQRFDPLDEEFDPNAHMARFELNDPSKKPGTVGVVTLCGYKMHERIIRPAEVGVVSKQSEDQAAGSEER